MIMKMKAWPATRSRRQQKEDTGRSYLMELPTELLLEIISHLTLIPEAAFALTCKRMFAISGEILLSKSLRFTRDFAPLFHHYRNGHNFVTPRWQFMSLLENSRWRLCSKCLKLHPRSAFSSRELRHKPDDRTCNLGELAGIVDLCPCKKMTYRDKLKLADDLQVRKTTLDALGTEYGSTVSNRYCWHKCTEQYGPTGLTVSLFPELNEEGQLVVRTEYQLTTESGQVGKEEYMTPRFGCAHRSVDLWLSSVYQTTICRLFDNFCASCRRISVCATCNTTLTCHRKQPFQTDVSGKVTYSFYTERSLGAFQQRLMQFGLPKGFIQPSRQSAWRIAMSSVPGRIDEEVLSPATDEQPMDSLYSSIRML
ncbi:hypothetical protein N7507_004401 [Penicillium longicatenatum]|nr:hypothetical protein N7507_004401 [Penicillium longicatenatum]